MDVFSTPFPPTHSVYKDAESQGAAVGRTRGEAVVFYRPDAAMMAEMRVAANGSVLSAASVPREALQLVALQRMTPSGPVWTIIWHLEAVGKPITGFADRLGVYTSINGESEDPEDVATTPPN